jgi:hypothetical protein
MRLQWHQQGREKYLGRLRCFLRCFLRVRGCSCEGSALAGR